MWWDLTTTAGNLVFQGDRAGSGVGAASHRAGLFACAGPEGLLGPGGLGLLGLLPDCGGLCKNATAGCAKELKGISGYLEKTHIYSV